MSETLREMLKRHEGWSLAPYICPAGKHTIGAGFNYDANPLPQDIEDYLNENGSITDDMAERLLFISVGAATLTCHSLYARFETFSETRQNALIDFVFNVGGGTAVKFKKMRAAIEAGDWNEAANQMHDSEWYHQVGLRGPELVDMIREG